MNIIEKQFDCFNSCELNDHFCELCYIRRVLPNSAIPCIHTMLSNMKSMTEIKPIVSAKDVGSRWKRTNLPQNPINNINEDKSYKRSNKLDFITKQSLFYYYISISNQNKEANDILEEAIRKLQNIKMSEGDDEPLTLSMKGNTVKYPARNVLAGKQRTKRKYSKSKETPKKKIKTK